MNTAFCMVLPDRDTDEEEKYPVMWFLHGFGGNCDNRSVIQKMESLAQQYGIAVVMPDAQNSSYCDMVCGPKWATYLTTELRKYILNHFPVSGEREKNFIAGVSMGGYGAVKLALQHPELYAACAGMGSGFEVVKKYEEGTEPKELHAALAAAYGPERCGSSTSSEDCFQLARELKNSGQAVPRILLCCGEKDFALEENKHFYKLLCKLGYQAEFIGSQQDHTQKAWNSFLPRVFEWLMPGGSRE